MTDKNSRVKKELSELQRDTKSGVLVELKSDDLQELQGTIKGPEGTPYEGGTYKISIQIPKGYPFEPPKMKFLTKIWHPNISSQTGAICLDILKDQWSPALTIKTALLSLQALLCSPEPDDPQDAQVATMYLNNYEKFSQTAKFWTATYAQASASTSSPDSPALTRLLEMGFSREQCIDALAQAGGDENDAVNRLLSG
uniref:E2 ubiquitin-conjugating enzyme n=1 Tax=Aureoumbra lagunensis TaxID=44058 RepID=A0A7S3NI41_9STRA|mmetsp:Transcript_6450/g.9063  ORF Transcript_6450/g.9063 Transcript_6450/m.9063 type:complete len:198 (+) Transcript_6450:56-649(+)|eukprot:CAMPEP_0197312532 /NCGR_PEP_ID=MMETSP0891-20130614/21138_1 /TAXON_ID=44058 ORGANISM="Aureoumbra lagunensis, Strain CCMP1510" /NCGR_SAMPLE_ID=MMETSP0891 /ASSEMBLY_ACC=CAM_ASM_000534 /LENGTH=197 /DNA_ID=CAMNT_0042799747 /DNA_START=24 /DNA_END=617 /DNA_ORIENTATION=-